MAIDTFVSSNFALINGDCFEELKKIESWSIDLILTDPPYNLANYSTGNMKFGWRAEINNDVAKRDEKTLNPQDLVHEFKRILSPQWNIFIFCSYNLLGDYHKVFDPLFDTFQFMVWHKTNPIPNIRKTSFLNSCELIVCCRNKWHTRNFLKQNEMHNFFESGICMWAERIKDWNGKNVHPTQKPLKLLEHIITIASNEWDTILDCFNGVWSTWEASLKLNRKYIGIELDPTYYNFTKKRLLPYQHYPQKLFTN